MRAFGNGPHNFEFRSCAEEIPELGSSFRTTTPCQDFLGGRSTQWLSSSASRFHTTCLKFKPQVGQDRLSLSFLQWVDLS
ncbi:hypothetical protein TNCV_2171061 [Trichonephila clavipes]|nr:hypothetical protein TNCV_2171061 [Trichonephila clavipes]